MQYCMNDTRPAGAAVGSFKGTLHLSAAATSDAWIASGIYDVSSRTVPGPSASRCSIRS